MGLALERAMWRLTDTYCCMRLLTWAPSPRINDIYRQGRAAGDAAAAMR